MRLQRAKQFFLIILCVILQQGQNGRYPLFGGSVPCIQICLYRPNIHTVGHDDEYFYLLLSGSYSFGECPADLVRLGGSK